MLHFKHSSKINSNPFSCFLKGILRHLILLIIHYLIHPVYIQCHVFFQVLIGQSRHFNLWLLLFLRMSCLQFGLANGCSYIFISFEFLLLHFDKVCQYVIFIIQLKLV